MEQINWRRFLRHSGLGIILLAVAWVVDSLWLHQEHPMSAMLFGYCVAAMLFVLLVLELCDAKAERLRKQSTEAVIAEKIRNFKRPDKQ